MSQPVKVHLGCGTDYRPGWINCDVVADVRADKHFDLETFPWPFEDNSVDEIFMDQVLEHLSDTMKVMAEIHRILRPGGFARIIVPYAKADGAYQDPTHKRFFTEKTMHYFSEDYAYNFYSKCRFKIRHARLTGKNDTTLKKIRNAIPFRPLLNWFFWNLYDCVDYEIEKPRAN
ncbi:MAG: methyltransferase domain-containing protein [Verrucomicrobiota bacterium]